MRDAIRQGSPVLRTFAVLITLRSLVYNVLFYLTVVIYSILALPTFALPPRAILWVARFWARTNVWLLRIVCGVRLEVRGREHVPAGPLIVAAKHQSAWDTFALMTLFPHPVYVLKRELQMIPIFGWYTIKAGMIPVHREKRGSALAALTRRAAAQIRIGAQLIIFPEGTRRPPGAPPDYKPGVALMYKEFGVPCLPVALNSGLFWPRRTFRRLPGTIVVEFLDPIPPGLDRRTFMARLEQQIEQASARLLSEGVAPAG